MIENYGFVMRDWQGGMKLHLYHLADILVQSDIDPI